MPAKAGKAGSIISLDHAGNFSTFCPELALGIRLSEAYNPFIFGNVKHDTFASMAFDARFGVAVKGILSGRDKCKTTCDYFRVCGGGSPSNRYAELGTLDASETAYCRNHTQAIADAALDYFEGIRTDGLCSSGVEASMVGRLRPE